MDLKSLGLLVVVSLLLLLLVLAITTIVSRYVLRFPVEDEIVVVFCGSKKSLASGLPMASVLFAGSQVGLIVLPLMLFHQLATDDVRNARTALWQPSRREWSAGQGADDEWRGDAEHRLDRFQVELSSVSGSSQDQIEASFAVGA